MDKSKEQFEKWLKSTGQKPPYAVKRGYWKIWQASRESLDVDYVHYECPGCGAAYLNDNVRCDCGNEETLNKFEYARLSHEN